MWHYDPKDGHEWVDEDHSIAVLKDIRALVAILGTAIFAMLIVIYVSH